jgi:hypothetical protein
MRRLPADRSTTSPASLQLQVLRDRGLADRQLPGEFADGAWPLGEALEDRASRRVGKRVPALTSVSIH